MAYSVDPDQTAPIGAVCSGSTLFASILNVRQLFAADNFSRRHFHMHFFLGALRVKGQLLPFMLTLVEYFCLLHFSPISIGLTCSIPVASM